ncbi:MAG TPA: cytidine deaminase [Fimbriimonadaceae bacterium]|nr:cytidine deaminase [Fimbriimonadaceae bacterium]
MSDLTAAAQRARENAYAPYSGYKVGAAVRGPDGRIWTGCNVENVSYPMSVCAERNAVAAMVLDGGRQIEEAAVATRDGGPPCGGCLQVLLEFASDPAKTVVHLVAEDGRIEAYTLGDLIPHGFDST